MKSRWEPRFVEETWQGTCGTASHGTAHAIRADTMERLPEAAAPAQWEARDGFQPLCRWVIGIGPLGCATPQKSPSREGRR